MNSNMGPIHSSPKIRIRELELYFTKSDSSNKENITYFLFVKNKGLKTYTFPSHDLTIKFVLKSITGVNCYTKDIVFNPKTVVKDSTEFYAFNISVSELSVIPSVCNSILLPEEGIRAYRKVFTGVKSDVDAILAFQDKEIQNNLVIKNEKWY